MLIPKVLKILVNKQALHEDRIDSIEEHAKYIASVDIRTVSYRKMFKQPYKNRRTLDAVTNGDFSNGTGFS